MLIFRAKFRASKLVLLMFKIVTFLPRSYLQLYTCFLFSSRPLARVKSHKKEAKWHAAVRSCNLYTRPSVQKHFVPQVKQVASIRKQNTHKIHISRARPLINQLEECLMHHHCTYSARQNISLKNSQILRFLSQRYIL